MRNTIYDNHVNDWWRISEELLLMEDWGFSSGLQ
jgi:hypothetical protein